MDIMVRLPDASCLRPEAAKRYRIPAGTPVHRLHPERFSADQFNDTSNGNARFSPIVDRRGSVIPTIYGAETFECAVAEIILRTPDTVTGPVGGQPHIVHPSDFAEYVHSELRTTSDLDLVDLSIEGQRRLGVGRNALLAGPSSSYPVTRDWAEAIHSGFEDIGGLWYPSAQFGPKWAVVLFGDRCKEGFFEVVSRRKVCSAQCHDQIESFAEKFGITYLDV